MTISYKTYISGALLAGMLAFSGCQKEAFVETNINPEGLTTVPPANQFLNATLSLHGQDFEAYYDYYQRIMPWMQYSTAVNGNGQNFTQVYDNFSQRYGRLYNGVGNSLVDLEKLVEALPAEEQPRYVHMIRIARILRSYYTFYVSDIYGSIPYSEAFQARYGGTLTPKYDAQQAIFTSLDTDLKEAVATLKTPQAATQVALGTSDQYYAGNTQQWVKAANALRLKIALRLAKRDPARLKAVAQEVLASPASDLMSSNADGWVFVAPASYTGGSDANWNPSGLRAGKPIVDFMWDTQDPRLDAFFTQNIYSQANIDLLIADKQLPAGTKASDRRYIGGFTSPDAARTSQNIQRYYTPRFLTLNGNRTAVDTLSYIQPRLFQAGFADATGTAGTGRNYFPVITFAEFAFMRAELGAQAITGESAKTWYETGVTASLDWYDMVATGAQVTNYTAMTAAEKTAYLANPKVAFNAAKAMDLIASQEYIHFLRQPTEGWATWKRTGLPNPSSTLMLPALISNGATLTVPRRAPLALPNVNDPNYANRKAAIDEMAKEAGFGRDPQDATGRVWWDQL
jgi:hypothetical protein